MRRTYICEMYDVWFANIWVILNTNVGTDVPDGPNYRRDALQRISFRY